MVTCAQFLPPDLGRVRPDEGDGRMKRSRFSEEQIIAMLKEQEAVELLR